MDDFVFNESALFFSRKNDFDKVDFKKELKKLDVKSDGLYIPGENNNIKYNFIMFQLPPRQPTFYKGTDVRWNETKTAYFLIVYNDEYAAILKQNTSIPSEIANHLEQIDYEKLLKLFITNETEYKHLSMRNIDGSDYAIRSKSFDGVDLKRNISSVSASKYFVQNMRGKSNDKSFALYINTSRINQYKPQKTFNEICCWVKEIFTKLKATKKTSLEKGFLSHFAKHVSFSECKGLTPSSLLLNTQHLLDLLQNVTKDTDKIVSDKINDNFKLYEKVLENTGNSRNTFSFEISKNDVFKLTVLNNKIVLENDLWKKCKIEITNENGTEIKNLQELANEENLFNVFFSGSSMTYSNGQLFSDNRLMSNAEGLLEYIKTEPLLKKATCEKFIDERASHKKASCWDQNSEFEIMETKYKKKHKCFVCDDCKTEWADFIGISDNKVTFYACKHSEMKVDDSRSASKFHEVISQSLKNLGNLNPSKSQLNAKYNEWKKTYLNTKIQRTSSTDTELESAIDKWQEKQYQPNFEKEFAIVVNFISKKGLKKRFCDTKKTLSNSQKTDTKTETTFQQIWLLSSFVSTCLEAGVTPKIICRE